MAWLSLILAPTLLLLARGSWLVERELEPSSAAEIALGDPGAPRAEVPLAFRPEGASESESVEVAPGFALEVRLPESGGDLHLVLQASAAGEFSVSGSSDGVEFRPLWRVARSEGQAGLRTRSSLLPRAGPLARLRVEPLGAGRERSVAALSIERRPLVVPQWPIVPLLWLAWGLGSLVPALRRGWLRADPWIAGAIAYQGFFRWGAPWALALGLLAGLGLAFAVLGRASRRAPRAACAASLATVLFAGVAVPPLVGSAVAASLARQHELTVDHRLRPDGAEINADAIRFRGGAGDLRQEEFVVLFLGDSFTYGLDLDYADSYPYAFERLAAALDCAAKVRAVNAGWTSSSPLLALRWLREMGESYRPDLVIYDLDVTDFYDDLSYEQQLRRGGDLEIAPGRVLAYWLKRLGWTDPWSLAQLVRARPDLDDFRPELQPPRDRFFVTAEPLERSRARIEAGVVKNLAEIERFARETLAAPTAVVLYPRAYQYSSRESEDNWEAPWYEALGPHVREPFRYFAEAAPRLPYAVVDVLPDFERAVEFPLYRQDDPHWNAAGAELAARAVLGRLVAAGLLPCRTRA